MRVQWGSPYLVLAFESVWQNGVENEDNPKVTLSPAGLMFNMFENIVEIKKTDVVPEITMIKSHPPYDDKQEEGADVTVTVTYYFMLYTNTIGGSAFVSAKETATTEQGQPTTFVTIRVSHILIPPTAPEHFVSSSDPFSVDGNIGAWKSAFIARAGGGSLSDESVIGPVSGEPSEGPRVRHEKNAVIMIKLSPIRGIINAIPFLTDDEKKTLEITFTVAHGPTPQSGDEGDPTYQWKAQLLSFKSGGGFDKFPVDDKTKPLDPIVDNWPEITEGAEQENIPNPIYAGLTGETRVKFMVDLITLEVEVEANDDP